MCSGARADLVRSLGAAEVIDHTRPDFADGSRHFDLILDIGGRTAVSRLRRALTRTGWSSSGAKATVGSTARSASDLVPGRQGEGRIVLTA